MKTLHCPKEMLPHLEDIFSGCYDIPLEKAKVIIDVGANVGAFAVWANQRWPQSKIICFEPISTNFDYLIENTKNIKDIVLHKKAVTGFYENSAKMFLGKNNPGEASFFNLGQQNVDLVEEVQVEHPKDLPLGDVLKIDTEGSEMDILVDAKDLGYKAIVIEYHRRNDRRYIDQILHHYTLVGSSSTHPDYGIVKYMAL